MTTRDIFYQHIHTHSTETGFEMPLPLEYYLADLLTERLREPELIPQPSFAERYLELYSEHRLSEFKAFADTSLLFVSLMPEYGTRRGLDISYYATLGISVYYTLGDLSRDARFTQLGNWFYHLQRFLSSALGRRRDLEFADIWRTP